ncbi:MAG: response regulator [Candidatus Nanosalina sp.]
MDLFNDFGNGKIDLMLVDDSRDILELSEMVLDRENNDFSVHSTTDPDEVLESFNGCELDAIISDYDMPQMTGIELLEEVREVDQDFPFILYTGKGTEEIAVDAINAGVTDYFQKEAGTEHYSLIANSVENSVSRYRDSERSQVLREVVEKSDNPIVVTNTDSEIV